MDSGLGRVLFILVALTVAIFRPVDSVNVSSASASGIVGSTSTAEARPALSVRHRIRQHVLANYDKMVHPVVNSSQPVTVGVGLAVIHIGISDIESAMHVDAWMRLSWTDEYLRWNASDFDNLTSIHFATDEIWRPDIELYNSAQSAAVDSTQAAIYGQTHLLVDNEGVVLWVPPVHLASLCTLNLHKWPFDLEKCSLKFGSWTSHGKQIDLVLFKNKTVPDWMNFYTSDREWRLVGAMATRDSVRYDCCGNEEYPDITFDFFMARSSPTYTTVYIMPCLATLTMTVFSFYLDIRRRHSTGRLFLNGLSLLVAILFLIYLGAILPYHETKLPVIIKFYGDLCALASLAVVANIVIINLASEGRPDRPAPPSALVMLFCSKFGHFICLDDTRRVSRLLYSQNNVEMSSYSRSNSCSNSAGPTSVSNSTGCRSFTLGQNQVSQYSQMTNHSDDDDDGDVEGRRPDPEMPAASSPTSKADGLPQAVAVDDLWLLVAGGLQRICFIFYSFVLLIMTLAYIDV